jgi:glyoxylase-like metal-dependent hydrolase (beta-lactamase superfamily II)
LRRDFGIRFALGQFELASLRVMSDPRTSYLDHQLAQLISLGAGDLVGPVLASRNADTEPQSWIEPDDWLVGGTTIEAAGRELAVYSTPGHTQGHVVFADQSTSELFAGDHVLPTITPSIGFEASPNGAALADFLNSLRLLQALPDMKLLPAHGPTTASVHLRVSELLEHHADRLQHILAAVSDGAATAWDVARQLAWTTRGRRLSQLDSFNQMLATCEVGAHLKLLVAQELVRVDMVNGVLHFSAITKIDERRH